MKVTENKSIRHLSLDVLKGLGIFYLIVLHQLVWFFTQADGYGLLFKEAYSLCYILGYKSGLHCLGFQVPMLAGITFYFTYNRKNISFSYVIKRALLLSFLGFMMNFLTWGMSYAFDWDVLQFIAVSMVFSYLIFKLPNKFVNIIL